MPGSLRSLFQSFRSIFKMSYERPAEFDYFPTEGCHVYEWERNLTQLYTSQDLSVGDVHRARMTQLRVVEIRRFKQPKPPEHEYLVARISYHKQDFFLCIERAGEDVNDNLGRTKPSVDNSNATSRSSSGSSKISYLHTMGKYDAHDLVTQMEGWPATRESKKKNNKNGKLAPPGSNGADTPGATAPGASTPDSAGDTLIEILTPSSGLLTLLDLALLANVVHSHSDKYHLLSRQCFWFADSIIRVLEFRSGSDVSVHQVVDPRLAGTGVEWQCEKYDPDAGKWNNIPIQKTREDLVEKIKVIYDERKAEVQVQMNDASQKLAKAREDAADKQNAVRRADMEAVCRQKAETWAAREAENRKKADELRLRAEKMAELETANRKKADESRLRAEKMAELETANRKKADELRLRAEKMAELETANRKKAEERLEEMEEKLTKMELALKVGTSY